MVTKGHYFFWNPTSARKKPQSPSTIGICCCWSQIWCFSNFVDISALRHVSLFHGSSIFSYHLYSYLPLISTIKPPRLLHTHHLITHHNHHPTIAPSTLLSCTNLQTLKQTHALLLTNSFNPFYMAPNLITLYTQFHDLQSVLSVFKTLPEKPNTYIWNLTIKSHVDFGYSHVALAVYKQMREEPSVPHDTFTFPLVNRAILSLQNGLRFGEMIHCVAVGMGFGGSLYFCNTMIELYVKNGSVDSARKLFDEMPERDLVSWTSMISGEDVVNSFKLFNGMRVEGLEPNSVTLMTMLRRCCFVQGRQLHGHVIKRGLEGNGSVQNSILNMYSKTGCFEETELFFTRLLERDVVSWNILISTYSLKGESSRVVESFNKMRTEAVPSFETLTSVISAFAKSGSLLQGQKIHGYAIKSGVSDIVLFTCFVDFYAKCGELEKSFRLFEEVPQKNNITWSTMMSGFVQNGHFKEAIEIFHEMQFAADVKPGIDSLRSLILAYTHLGSLRLGKVVHGFVTRNMFCSSKKDNTAMETSILSMYAKCGSILSARRCFDEMGIKDVVSWSSMIEGYTSHGLGLEAMSLFEEMIDEGIEPNAITFLSLLTACSHSGLVTEGCRVFECMTRRFGVKPNLNHYTCMVDLLGRSGMLKQALAVIENMVVEPDSRIWGSVLAASKVYSDTKIAVYAARQLLVLENDNAGYHTLLSNFHATTERWDEAETVRAIMNESNLKKLPGWSCIEAKDGFHTFLARDGSHPHMGEIYETVQSLNRMAVEEIS